MGFDFSFSPQERLLKRSCRNFMANEIKPYLPEDDWSGHGGDSPLHLVKKLQDQGYFGMSVPRDYGGSGMGEVGYCIVMEEASAVDASLVTILGAHTGIGLMPIYLFGNEEQRERYVRPAAEGKEICAFALTEPTAGSDAASIKTKAVRDGTDYLLNGTKIWCSNGNFADTIVVFAVTDEALGAHGGVTAFIVEKGTPGMTIGTIEDKLGIRHSNTAEIIFDNCRVPKENILGKVGEGFIAALTALDGGRVGLAAGSLGGVRSVLEQTLEHAKFRKREGKALAEHQSVQWKLADMLTDLHMATYATYHAAHLTNHYYHKIAAGESISRSMREDVSRAAAATKVYCSEMMGRALEQAMIVYGADSLKWKNGLERGWRDQQITEIYEGTNEIQRMILARELIQQGVPY